MLIFCLDLVTDANASTAAWQLLEHLIWKYEQDNQTVIHKIVAGKIISLSAFLPQRLVTSYKVTVDQFKFKMFFLYHQQFRKLLAGVFWIIKIRFEFVVLL